MRVVVTAVGIASPLGMGAERTFRALAAGERAQRPVSLFDVADQRCRIAAEVPDLDPAALVPARAKGTMFLSRADALALFAAREALAKARLPADADVDLILGGTVGGMYETETRLVAMFRDPASRTPDPALAAHPISATADRLRELVLPFRRTRTLSSACSSGGTAVALGEAWIRNGKARRVLAGGADALSRLVFTGFNLLSSLDPEPCKPFDRRRAGLNLGEAAAFLLLEREEDALARGAEPLAEIAGWAVGSEARHITQPEESGETAARLLGSALARAGLSPADIGYVNAHGTATPHNDPMETAALRTALGDALAHIPVSSCKGQIGHSLGAAGAVEAAITVLALVRGEIPPTVGLSDPDPRCDLVHVPGKARAHAFDAAISSSFGFGGAGTVLLFTRPGRFAPPEPIEPRRTVVTAAATLGPLGLRNDEAVCAYLAPGPAPLAGASSFKWDEHLDPARARRLDNAALRLVATAQAALRGAGEGIAKMRLGIATGLPIRAGAVGASFLAPILENGWRSGKPLVFPNLLISSPCAHASIYLGLRGPSLTAVEGAASAAGALSAALDLVEAGEADAMVVGAVSEWDALSEAAVNPVCFGSAAWVEPHTDGASAVVVEAAETAAARGARVLAEVAFRASAAELSMEAIPAPQDARALVIVPRGHAEVLAGTAWASVPRVEVAARAGMHEAVGGMAFAAAAAAIGAREASEVLVLEQVPGRAEVVLLREP